MRPPSSRAVRARRRRRLAVVAATCAIGLTVAAPPALAAQDPRVDRARESLAELLPLTGRAACDQRPEPDRWGEVGTPDTGMPDAVVSAHRGALTLAPENTLKSYEYAFAYGVELVEVDVQQTADGRFVALHDSTVDRTTDGTGRVDALTFDQLRALNAADYEPWRGSDYDPAQIASLEEVLALAARVGGGVELDVKGSVTAEGRLAELVGAYGLVEESVFNSADPRILLAEPGARLIYDRGAWEPPFLLYEIGQVFTVFGSRLDEYTPEAVAAIHDACGIVMPHAYDAGPAEEVAQFQAARAMGADGVQTNQPDLIVAAAGESVPSRFVVQGGQRAQLDRVCLVNAHNSLGFPGKQVTLRRGATSTAVPTGRDGCVSVSGRRWLGGTVTFPGDGAVQAASARLLPRRG